MALRTGIASELFIVPSLVLFILMLLVKKIGFIVT